MEKERGESIELSSLADKLTALYGGKLVGPLERFVKLLRDGDSDGAKAQIKNELFDKLTEKEREIILQGLYHGSGSPWRSMEQQ